MMKTLPSKLLCMVLAVLIIFSVFSCAAAESAAVPSNPEAQPAPQEDEIVKDFDGDAYYARLLRCAGHIQSLSDSFVPDVVLVLGSGLGKLADRVHRNGSRVGGKDSAVSAEGHRRVGFSVKRLIGDRTPYWRPSCRSRKSRRG